MSLSKRAIAELIGTLWKPERNRLYFKTNGESPNIHAGHQLAASSSVVNLFLASPVVEGNSP